MSTEATDRQWREFLRAGMLDRGFKDTVLVLPGKRVRTLATFHTYRGEFLYHCHNLVQEDMGTMRNFSIT